MHFSHHLAGVLHASSSSSSAPNDRIIYMAAYVPANIGWSRIFNKSSFGKESLPDGKCCLNLKAWFFEITFKRTIQETVCELFNISVRNHHLKEICLSETSNSESSFENCSSTNSPTLLLLFRSSNLDLSLGVRNHRHPPLANVLKF